MSFSPAAKRTAPPNRNQPFWQNCLVVIPSETGNHPRLVWGPYPGGGVSVSCSQVWSGISVSPDIVPSGWSLIATTNATTYQYTHEPVTGGTELYAHYR